MMTRDECGPEKRGAEMRPIYIGIHICIVCVFFVFFLFSLPTAPSNTPLSTSRFFSQLWLVLISVLWEFCSSFFLGWIVGPLRWQRCEIAALNVFLFFRFIQLVNFNWIVSVLQCKKSSSFKETPSKYISSSRSLVWFNIMVESVLRIQLMLYIHTHIHTSKY